MTLKGNTAGPPCPSASIILIMSPLSHARKCWSTTARSALITVRPAQIPAAIVSTERNVSSMKGAARVRKPNVSEVLKGNEGDRHGLERPEEIGYD